MDIGVGVIQDIVNVWDPLDVMAHAPADEYSSFSAKCFDGILQLDTQNVNEIYNMLLALSREEFGDSDSNFDNKEVYYAAKLMHRILSETVD